MGIQVISNTKVGARRGHGVKVCETTRKALSGRGIYITSRERQERDLHAHAVLLNVTKNRDDSYQVMTNDRIFEEDTPAQGGAA